MEFDVCVLHTFESSMFGLVGRTQSSETSTLCLGHAELLDVRGSEFSGSTQDYSGELWSNINIENLNLTSLNFETFKVRISQS